MARIHGKSRIAVILVVVALAVAIPVLAALLGADEVLRRLENSADSTQNGPPPDAAQLLTDIQRYRREADALDAAGVEDLLGGHPEIQDGKTQVSRPDPQFGTFAGTGERRQSRRPQAAHQSSRRLQSGARGD